MNLSALFVAWERKLRPKRFGRRGPSTGRGRRQAPEQARGRPPRRPPARGRSMLLLEQGGQLRWGRRQRLVPHTDPPASVDFHDHVALAPEVVVGHRVVVTGVAATALGAF